jgi:DNA polymerase III alpha subunit
LKKTGIALLNEGEGRELLRKRCREAGVSMSTIEELIRVELDSVGKLRRARIFERIDEVLEAESGCTEARETKTGQGSFFHVHSDHPAP